MNLISDKINDFQSKHIKNRNIKLCGSNGPSWPSHFAERESG